MHLDRMESSAAYFSYAFDRAAIISQLIEYSTQFETGNLYRVRLLLDEAGNATITHTQHADTSLFAGRIRVASHRTSSADVFLRHKTTHRELYDSQYASCRSDGFDEVIFLNEKDEVTEGAISNIVIRRTGKLLTPPLSSGVLPGVFRRHLLETALTEEAVLTLQDLESAEAIYLCNSLRGLREVRLLPVSATDPSLDTLLTTPGS
jgi:para-aminobenzoate synthetase/4-amino-4-deoxychorismate lyase